MGEKVLYLLVSAKVYAFIPNRLLSFVTCEFEIFSNFFLLFLFLLVHSNLNNTPPILWMWG